MQTALDDSALTRLLDDDCPFGDLTTDALSIGARGGHFTFAARYPMRLCGVEEAVRLCCLAGLEASTQTHSGATLQPGQAILGGGGRAAHLHRVWKTAQVLLEWASGIANATADLVHAAGHIPVACTRKSAPGTKALSIKAVRAGGATLHRLGLSETILIFAEHRVFLDESAESTIARLKTREPEKKIVVEVGDIPAALQWAAAGAEVLQLEKFTPEALAECCQRLGPPGQRPLIAAAGGVHAGNAAAYARAGADLLVTSAPFSAPPLDVTVRFEPC